MSHIQPKLTIGHIAPNFEGNTASVPLRFHQWAAESWSIVFSLSSSAPVPELTEVARRLPDLEQRGIKVLIFSRNWQSDGLQWKILLQQYGKQPDSGMNVQIIADNQGKISTMYGMWGKSGDGRDAASARNTAFLINPNKIIQQVLAHPSSLSNGLSQMLRFVDENSGPLQGISTEIFGLDAKGRGNIYNREVSVSGGGAGAAVGVVQSAIGVVNNVKAARGAAAIADITGGDSSSDGAVNVVSGATDYIQHALTVMDSLADIGKAMPFVAPAFVIIKTIIAVEQRARDVDAKCTDLVQRVTFMLSHLPALKNIKVTDSTRQVIDRMNDVLKKAAALIQTYRKQSAIARRLSVHNKDRFASCADSLKDCTNDLMVSLQIHQSTQLDILTRPVPSDPEDEAAEMFVAAHGGLDAVKGNEELVKQFASEMKLSMDEKVMEQLNTNITEVLQQNQDRLEQSLNESVSASVIDGIRGLAAQINESAKEQTFVCVQCDKEYRDSTNGDKSCSFHRAQYDSRNETYTCCNTKNPCQAGRHRPDHHYDYLYGNFFEFAGNIAWAWDTVDRWVTIEDFNFDTSDRITASVGRLLRWKSGGAAPELPTILIRVGEVSISEPYLFKIYTIHDLEVASKVADITHQTVIYRSSHSKEQYAMAEWVLSGGVITGISITLKVSTSPTPFIRFCPIDITTATLSGEVKALSEGGLRSYRPDTPYVLPEMRQVCAALPEKALREVRKDFKTRTSPNLPVMLKVVSNPPLSAEASSSGHDYFYGTVSVFNKNSPKSMEPVSISSVSGFYRFIGEETYKPVKSMEMVDRVVLPVSIDPRQNWTFKFCLTVPRSEEELNISTRWVRGSFVARHRPLRIKLVLTDIEEEECSIVLDYVSSGKRKKELEKDDLAYFYVDDPLTWDRYGVDVLNTRNSVGVQFDVWEGNVASGFSFGEDQMKAVAYKALKTGSSEIDLKIGQNNYTGTSKAWSWKTWALVDLSCQRIYAFKVLITKDIVGTRGYACLGYVPCPDYGEFFDETRPIQYATEMVQFPDLEPYVAPPPPLLDDQFDDLPVASNAAAAGSASLGAIIGPAAQLAMPEELNQRLVSIDDRLSKLASIDDNLSTLNQNIARLGASIEQLVEILKAE
ncbi:hypothetical protein GYMLUDRAFT_507321 [Collybiopsis luxurians FD-317 M1]|uniref:Alkyl hydroperoxide reductase subunit C/ Thiol specific antioxidant domain-containing protein n=1 Tax=Collybiopsis luxurians FD-317 M1 TaxID=944289 RepID=A0A0D0CTB6_9AGAR|nr:hypothetical protein GYMLUDRAFT_507321 [Collybiopsis luxurians FD-317 M1]